MTKTTPLEIMRVLLFSAACCTAMLHGALQRNLVESLCGLVPLLCVWSCSWDSPKQQPPCSCEHWASRENGGDEP